VTDECVNTKHGWNDTDGKTEVLGREKTCPSAALSTTNLMWAGLKLDLASIVGGW